LPPPTDTFGAWHEFYALLGAASATMVGLLFVAASVASGVFSADRRAPLRMFLSASVVHFAGILAVSLIVLAPLQNWLLLGALILGCGIFGLIYYAMTWRDTMQDGLIASLELDDRIWYAILPVIGYGLETATGVMLVMGLAAGCPALAVAMAVLLVVGIHNAWDITVWTITHRRQ
jgi:hypothetical protein